MKHTPGPWYESGTGNHQGLVISRSTSANVAVAYDKKDARLIAAAPEMLEALLIVQDRIDRGWFPWIRPDDVWPNAVASAIAKAEVG